MSKYLVIELSTGVLFLTHAHTEMMALRFVSKNRMGSSHHIELFKAQKLIDMPEGTVARLTVFDETEPQE